MRSIVGFTVSIPSQTRELPFGPASNSPLFVLVKNRLMRSIVGFTVSIPSQTRELPFGPASNSPLFVLVKNRLMRSIVVLTVSIPAQDSRAALWASEQFSNYSIESGYSRCYGQIKLPYSTLYRSFAYLK